MSIFDEVKEIEAQALAKVGEVVSSKWTLRAIVVGGVVVFFILVFAVIS